MKNTKIAIAMITLAVGFVVTTNILVKSVSNKYEQHKENQDVNKLKCLDEFGTIKNEVISGDLYCQTKAGLVKSVSQ